MIYYCDFCRKQFEKEWNDENDSFCSDKCEVEWFEKYGAFHEGM